MSAIIKIQSLGFPWQTADPFLFCAYHHDHYPKGNGQMGPDASLEGRQIGQDFTIKDGWRMYHGDKVPGFPAHPHRGFETITVVTKGLVDHADSLGAAGRYGGGDVQWMTAGRGVQHSEMFPLIHEHQANELEMFQIWLNLPAKNKMTEPRFDMLWAEDIPIYRLLDENSREVEVNVIAGELAGHRPPKPPEASWAADPENRVLVWTIRLQAGAQWTLPADEADLSRNLYFYAGGDLQVEDQIVQPEKMISLRSDQSTALTAGDRDVYLLMLQGKPIQEPVAQYGPFVMNSEVEIQQAFMDYRSTEFGGWPWPRHDQVHIGKDRYARFADGEEEHRPIR